MPKEASFQAVFLGMILSLLFAVSNAYLALKIGTTISASIPAAILSMAIFRLSRRKASLLENNIVQTTATVGEGIAAGVAFTIPALFLLGAPPSIGAIFLLSLLGGVLGVLCMIPLRRFIIVEEDKKLPFPEGTACAEILKAGEDNSSSAMSAGWGFIAGIFYKVLSGILRLWKETPSWTLRFYENTRISLDTSPALLAIGYIIGFRVSSLIFSGSILAWFVIIPLIRFFGGGQEPIFPSETLIAAMSAQDIWSSYVRYIGAGTIAFGGIMSLIHILPVLGKTLKEGFREMTQGWALHREKKRTDLDIPLPILLFGSLGIMLALWMIPIFPMNAFTIILLSLLGFFFSAVTSITVGIVGSTSNPVSGMVITTLLITSLLFVFLGWTERMYLLSAITMSSVANITICMASTTSQDLKTGFLLGATPLKQQLVEIIATIIPALALGFVIYILNGAYTIGSTNMPAPQASMIAMIANGVINQKLPYTLFAIGIVIGILLEFLRIPILPFALGVYLPLSLTSATMVGGIVKKIVETKEEGAEAGLLLSSGIIGGDACMGILLAALAVFGIISPEDEGILPNVFSVIAYVFLAAFIGIYTYHKSKKA
mgnify:CR=1 FL=1